MFARLFDSQAMKGMWYFARSSLVAWCEDGANRLSTLKLVLEGLVGSKCYVAYMCELREGFLSPGVSFIVARG